MSRSQHVAVVAALVGVGLALRVANALTAAVHQDELHVVGDALWARYLPFGESLRFLRRHPLDHAKLDPVSGTLGPWGTSGQVPRWGHPCLFQYVAGPILALVPPGTLRDTIQSGRLVNAVVDTTTIALLPQVVRVLGGGAGAGLAAAALYAVFPPAVTYGSLGLHDAFLAPLMVLLVLVLASPPWTPARWAAAGVVSGLLVSAKQTGMMVLVLVPAAMIFLRRPSVPRALGWWALAMLAVAVAFTDPLAYVESILHPPSPDAAARLQPLSAIADNLRRLVQPTEYYWLSFARHGEPLAPLMARMHVVMTPPVVWLGLIALALAIARRHGRCLLLLQVPVALVLLSLPQTDAMWRLEILFPLLCASVALEIGQLPRRVRAAVVGCAALSGILPLLAQPVAGDGKVDLADLLVMNPQAKQRPAFFAPWRGKPLIVTLPPGVALERRLWITPGAYAVQVDATAPATVAVDGLPIEGPRAVVLRRLPRLTLALPIGGTVRGVTLLNVTRPGR